MSWRDILSHIEPEGIPFPMSRLYARLASSRILGDFYSNIANQVLTQVKSGRVLDIGTGPGRLPLLIASRNKYVHVTGVDLSPDMVKIATRKAREMGLENVDFKAGNASELPFGDREFDLVLSTLSFHHWKGPERALNEVYRVLREGGEAWIFDMPARMDPGVRHALSQRYGFIAAWFMYLHGFTEPFYDERTLEALAGSTSFKRHELDYKGLTFRLKLYK